MRVHIGSIKGTRGASLDLDLVQELPFPGGEAEGAFIGPVRVRAKVTNSGRCYVVRGRISAGSSLPCDRCLEAVVVPVEADFEEEFYSKGKVPSGRSAYDMESDEDASDDEDVDERNTFEGDAFSLQDVVRQYLVLGLPTKVVCRESCLGICPQCGQNRNEGSCRCVEDEGDPRMAALADLLRPSDE